MGILNFRNPGRALRVYGRSLLYYSSPRKILNALRTEYAYRTRVADVRSAPFILFLEPLYYCNLECPFCDRQVFPDARKNSAGKLSMALYDKILDEIGDYLFQCQIFGQGEPMLDWPLSRQIIEKTHARKIFTLLSTNSTLITPKIAREVVQCGLDHLVCAIDGMSQETYAMYRVGGVWEEAIDGMSQILEQRRKTKSPMEIEWQFLVHGHNQHEVQSAKQLARKLGVFIRFAPLRGMEFNPELQQYWKTEGLQRDVEPGKYLHDWPCYFLWRSLVLNSNAKVARCLVYQNVAEYADLNTMPVLEAYNHPTIQRARQLFSRKPVPPGEFPAPCDTCSFYQREHGGPLLDKPASLGLSLRVLARGGLEATPEQKIGLAELGVSS